MLFSKEALQWLTDSLFTTRAKQFTFFVSLLKIMAVVLTTYFILRSALSITINPMPIAQWDISIVPTLLTVIFCLSIVYFLVYPGITAIFVALYQQNARGKRPADFSIRVLEAYPQQTGIFIFSRALSGIPLKKKKELITEAYVDIFIFELTTVKALVLITAIGIQLCFIPLPFARQPFFYSLVGLLIVTMIIGFFLLHYFVRILYGFVNEHASETEAEENRQKQSGPLVELQAFQKSS